MSEELEVLKAANFDWTLHLQSVWQDQPYHIDNMQPAIEESFRAKLDDLHREQPASVSPLGWVLAGSGGVGKTHLLSALRAQAARSGSAFIMVDMTDVNDFWETVVVGYTSSLQEPYIDGRSQHHFVLENLVRQFSKREALAKNLQLIVDASRSRLKGHVNSILNVLAKRYRRETSAYKDAIRALIATNSDDFEIANLGQMWLQGLAIAPEEAKALGFYQTQQNPINIVRALSWLISLGSPAIVAFDQLDPIVRQMEFEVQARETTGNALEEARAKSIISAIGDGLSAMFDVTRRTLTILSCLESSWEILGKRILVTSADRYETPRVLKDLDDNQKIKSLIASRMQAAFQRSSFDPPYPTWPFPEPTLHSLVGVTPRELLKRCSQHRNQCLQQGEVTELATTTTGVSTPVTSTNASQRHRAESKNKLDELFESYRRQADTAALLDEKTEDQKLGDLIRTACACLLKECSLSPAVHAVLDTEFTGGKSIKPLHARIRLIFHDEEEREEHYCVRALQRSHATAYQNRLKLAMTQSGIDQALQFRHLTLLRTNPHPRGKVTAELNRRFDGSGGVFSHPPEDEIRTLAALHKMSAQAGSEFDSWLLEHRPASSLTFCKTAFAGLLSQSIGVAHPNAPGPAMPATVKVNQTDAAAVANPNRPASMARGDGKSQQDEKKRPFAGAGSIITGVEFGSIPIAESDDFPLGRRLVVGEASPLFSIPVGLLEKHVVVLAGAGSGKTVLLKRMIEEASLRGIPSIVVDGANDLAALGDRWPASPDGWSESDASLAGTYHDNVEKIIWTPGQRSGNPLQLELIPDLTATIDDPDEFEAAVAMVSGALSELLKLGNSKSDVNKRGILSKSLKFYIEQGGTGLLKYIELLADLPAEATLGITKEEALAKEISDSLRVLEETDPMISESGDVLDPAVLFGDDRRDENRGAGTRISVINLNFLSTPETQQRFLSQLATTLFAWIKKHPKPPRRVLRGLLVIDEAKDFVPSRKSTSCKESLMRLTAQARKYHLGVVFATQNPREIENTIIGNCSTQYYGKANSPAAINTICQQIAARGGHVDDIGRLEKGTFYVFNADAELNAPTKVRVPLCLSRHTTLDGDELLERARESKDLLLKLDAQPQQQ